MFAFVRFLEDDVCYALPVSNVKDFRPLHKTDFDNQKVYLVNRTEENGTGQPGNAQILALAENIQEFEHSILQKKMKIPKLSTKDVEKSQQNHFGEEPMPLRHKKAQEHSHSSSANSSKSLAAVVARLERNAVNSYEEDNEEDSVVEDSGTGEAMVPRYLYEELVHNYRQQEEEMRRLQQELERTRRQLVQQAKKLKEYGSLMAEVKELRDFNRRLQDVLLLRLGSEPMHDNGTQTIKVDPVEPIMEPREVCREEANASSSSSHSPSPRNVYTFNDGKVHLGGGIWVDEEKWHQLQRTQGDSKFTKNLAVMIWGTETLKNRSVTGVATKKKKDALPKPPLSPSKLKIVRECLYDRVSQETADSAEITQRLSKVNKYICEKIMDINKSIKNEERRESKLLI
ncbi:BEND5 protein, partial [Polyodon spathula]|nr:BEND5 protein [Polyodon spathula]